MLKAAVQRIAARVVFSRGDKTVRVAFQHYHQHRKYPALIRRTSQFLAHDESQTAVVGDVVMCQLSPQRFSKKKAFFVEKIVYPVRRTYDSTGMLHTSYDGTMTKDYFERVRHWNKGTKHEDKVKAKAAKDKKLRKAMARNKIARRRKKKLRYARSRQ